MLDWAGRIGPVRRVGPANLVDPFDPASLADLTGPIGGRTAIRGSS